MCQSFFKKILHEWRIYTQVVSRILYLDMYLSGMIVAYHLKHEPPSTTFSANIFQFEKKVVLGPTHLHCRGFSTCVCCHPQLWALTSLFSPLPRTTLCTKFLYIHTKSGAGRYSLCGTFPSRQVGRQPLAVRLYEDCSSIVSGLSSQHHFIYNSSRLFSILFLISWIHLPWFLSFISRFLASDSLK